VPVVHRASLRQPWIIFASASLLFAILAPALYAAVWLAWSNLLAAYLSGILQAAFSLQLTKALQRPQGKTRKTD
jgi:hypothetical protein